MKHHLWNTLEASDIPLNNTNVCNTGKFSASRGGAKLSEVRPGHLWALTNTVRIVFTVSVQWHIALCVQFCSLNSYLWYVTKLRVANSSTRHVLPMHSKVSMNESSLDDNSVCSPTVHSVQRDGVIPHPCRDRQPYRTYTHYINKCLTNQQPVLQP